MKHLLKALLFVAVPTIVKAQVAGFNFTGGAASPSYAAAHATVSDFTRTNVTTQSFTDWFNSGSWNTGASVDNTEFIEVTVQANTGYQLNVSAIHFNVAKTSTGPADIRVAHDLTGSFTNYKDTSLPSTSVVAFSWDFADFTVAAGTTLSFRIYGWNAGGGNLRIDDFAIDGAVTPASGDTTGYGNTPFVFDTTKQFVGIATPGLPQYRLDVNGTAWVQDRLFVGAVDTPHAGNVYKLAVNGEAIVTKLWVKKYFEWPDFVFEKEYKLPSLAEVERFIKTYKHLPGVVPASTVAEKGIDVGVNQAALLQKVEELTLYLIQQQKQIDEQNKKIKQLEKKLNKKNR